MECGHLGCLARCLRARRGSPSWRCPLALFAGYGALYPSSPGGVTLEVGLGRGLFGLFMSRLYSVLQPSVAMHWPCNAIGMFSCHGHNEQQNLGNSPRLGALIALFGRSFALLQPDAPNHAECSHTTNVYLVSETGSTRAERPPILPKQHRSRSSTPLCTDLCSLSEWPPTRLILQQQIQC
jgi:hypothetical protein